MKRDSAVWILEMAADKHTVPAALATMDLAMLFSTGGQERDLDQFTALLQDCGLTVASVAPLTAPYYLIQARRSDRA